MNAKTAIKCFIAFYLAFQFSLMLISCSVPQESKMAYGWIEEESCFIDYAITGNKITFRYLVSWVNNTDKDEIIRHFSCKFKQREMKGWFDGGNDYLVGCDQNGEPLKVIIPAHGRCSSIYTFVGDYLGGTVNEKLSFPIDVIWGSMESNIDRIDLSRGVGNVSETNIISEISHFDLLTTDSVPNIINNMSYMAVQPTSDMISNVEYLKFDIVYIDEVKSIYILYDYSQKKEYVLYEKALYLLNDYRKLRECTVKCSLYKYADIRYYRNSSIDDMTFRYDPHGADIYNYNNFVCHKYFFSNMNQPAVHLDNRYDSVKYCTDLLKIDAYKSLCFYDDKANCFFIEFYNPDGFLTVDGNSIVSESIIRGPEVLHIVIDENGVIIELYSMLTAIYNSHFE